MHIKIILLLSLFLLTITPVFAANVSAEQANPAAILAHCEELLNTHDVVGVQVKYPGYKNHIIVFTVAGEPYGHSISEEYVVTQASCGETTNTPSLTIDFESTVVIDDILSVENPITTFFYFEESGQLTLEVNSVQKAMFNAIKRGYRVFSFLGFIK